jgi:exopolysaccharide biosynthesis polyprenyl glycosylphosphotransferase
VLYVWLFSLVLVIAGRELHRQLTTRLRVAGFGRDRVLIVGSGDAARLVINQIHSRPELGLEIIGAVNGAAVQDVAGVPVIGHFPDLPELIDALRIGEVIVALPEMPNRDLVQLIGACQRGRTSIKIYPDMFAYMAGGMSIDELGGMPLLTVRDMPLRGWKLALKRGLDIFGSMIGLVVLSPLLLLTAILIRLESPGPIWFCQERAGLDGRPFPMIKFRTMRHDAEKRGPGWTVQNDPRVTRIGKWMRKSNWDEIPNLINVLLGQMSLVGPRPEQPYYVQKFREQIPRYMERHREKAGMTGWAQVNGFRGDTSVEDRTKYDLYYVENWSLWFDIKIIIRTIIQTVLGRSKNAY